MNQPFFSALGLPLWKARPGFFSEGLKVTQQSESNTELEAVATQTNISQPPIDNTTSIHDESSTASTEAVALNSLPWVWVGAGLADIWQNPQRPEWQLTLNILKAFDRSISELHFVDSQLCQSEEAIMNALDTIIDLGVDRVFVFERNTAIIEDLQAGAELIDLPSFEQLFTSAEAKKSLYQILCQANGIG
ncbi:hypothetical protein [Hydrogenovibrio sp. SC-1]|uniref:hypothetical protein n=1 Tax=Hydrogenovibrio sp. SC-1 TaxID=2065820 RepID=UPI001179CD98|nr:hypothetical protein [Hydrogenovibrio sp. SC-1]